MARTIPTGGGDAPTGRARFDEVYARSLSDPDGFWGEAAAAIFLGDRLVFSPSIGPVAPGQTAALYDPSDPTSVLGSAVVAR